MVEINQANVERLIEEVNPIIEHLTGRSNRLDNLSVKLIKREELKKYVNAPLYEKLNLSPEEISKIRYSLESKIYQFVVNGNYEPVTGSMILVPENLSCLTNKSGLKLILGHELVHRGQFVNNPSLADKYFEIAKIESDAVLYNKKDSPNKIQTLMTLIEGGAQYVQDQIQRAFYSDAIIIPSISTSLFLLGASFLKLLKGDLSFQKSKIKQYTRGREIIKEVYKTGGREAVNSLYSLNWEGILAYSSQD